MEKHKRNTFFMLLLLLGLANLQCDLYLNNNPTKNIEYNKRYLDLILKTLKIMNSKKNEKTRLAIALEKLKLPVQYPEIAFILSDQLNDNILKKLMIKYDIFEGYILKNNLTDIQNCLLSDNTLKYFKTKTDEIIISENIDKAIDMEEITFDNYGEKKIHSMSIENLLLFLDNLLNLKYTIDFQSKKNNTPEKQLSKNEFIESVAKVIEGDEKLNTSESVLKEVVDFFESIKEPKSIDFEGLKKIKHHLEYLLKIISGITFNFIINYKTYTEKSNAFAENINTQMSKSTGDSTKFIFYFDNRDLMIMYGYNNDGDIKYDYYSDEINEDLKNLFQ
jgi:hypothetical protein